MIVDMIERLCEYDILYPGISKVKDFLESCSHGELTPGCYHIDGDRIYAVLQQYETADASELLWECHEKYADIHCILGGEESICWADRDDIGHWSAFDVGSDSSVSSSSISASSIYLHENQVAILLPQDAHKPKCSISSASFVTKIVVKLLLPTGR